MERFLENKKAVVTGGTRGIGLEVARALLLAGSDVVLCGRTPLHIEKAIADLSAIGSGRKVAGTTADVSSSNDVRKLFQFADKELGGLDILVNNAGSGLFRPAADITVEQWDDVIGTNLSGAFYCSREALSRFRSQNGGWILNISSLAGKNPMPGGAAYNASKFGLNGFSEAMMMDHRYDNVKVSYIMPGSVDTEFNGHDASQRSTWKVAPEDVAEIVLDILRKPGRTLVSRVEVRPSKPPRK